MKLSLKTGGEIELADLKTLDKEIEDTEEQLARLRRLRKVTAELAGVPSKAEPKANGTPTPTPTTAAEAGK